MVARIKSHLGLQRAAEHGQWRGDADPTDEQGYSCNASQEDRKNCRDLTKRVNEILLASNGEIVLNCSVPIA